MSRYLNRWVVLAALLALLLGIFLPPLINVNRFRPQIAGALSRALGRPVSVGAVSLRLFPWPGLNLERLVVQDDPAFSAEPLLRADQVTASLRLASLWRGRLEIARLSLSYPSLNLVRAPSGHWNLESLLERARQAPVAPTTKTRAESRLRFPYVEAEGGRINLKIGQEKKVYALSDADFALWLERENEWHLRLAARPVRTDANLSDTGTLRITGKVERAATLSDTPLDLQLVLRGAQLGQLTTLIYGRDRGWRGEINVNAALRGMPAHLRVEAEASGDDFRRYDISTSGGLRLAAHCAGTFSTITQDIPDLACRSTVGDGTVEVRGQISGVLPPRGYDLAITAHGLPAGKLVSLAQRMKRDLPPDLVAEGTIGASFALRKPVAGGAAWTGSGTASRLELRSGMLKEPLKIGELAFVLEPAGQNGHRSKDNAHATPGVTSLRVDSLPLDLGSAAPARLEARFSRTGYNLALQGEGQVPRLLELARVAGLRAPYVVTSGVATVDLSVAGVWSGFAAPVITGTAQLRGTTAQVPGFAAPLQIVSALMTASPETIAVDSMVAGFPGTHVDFSGWLHLPRACSPGETCPVEFQLDADQLSTDDLNRLLNPALRKRPWYDLIGPSRPRAGLLAQMNARGVVHAGRMVVHNLAINRVSGSVQLDQGVVTISNLHAEVFGGKTTGELRADFAGTEPLYRLRGDMNNISVAALAAMTRGDWGSGRANASYRVSMSGSSAAELWDSAAGSISFEWRDGTLTHLALNGASGPLRIRHFQGEATLHGAQFTFAEGKLDTPGGVYQVSGTASLDRQLELKLMRGQAQGYDVGGTLEKPRVKAARLPHTEAALKP